MGTQEQDAITAAGRAQQVKLNRGSVGQVERRGQELFRVPQAGGRIIRLQFDDPQQAVAGARCVVTDTWVSMSDDPHTNRHNLLAPYRVTAALMAKAAADAIFMHCLPAHRGEEVSAEVIDGPQSVVFDEAENRLHAQKGVLAWVLGAARKVWSSSVGLW